MIKRMPSEYSPAGRWRDSPVPGTGKMFEFAHPPCETASSAGSPVAREIRNESGKTARGIEIELAGFGEHDVFRAYYLNRYGSPGVMRTGDLIRVRFESVSRTGVESHSQTSLVQVTKAGDEAPPTVWEFALYGSRGCERFRLEMSTPPVTATYRWLFATGAPDDLPSGIT
ncbi:MAG: hypothetical protein ABI790_12270 [Betaproteobacteria bacterium]